MGIESQEYIGNGGLITGQKVLVAREVLKDYEVMTEDKNLYGYAPKGVPSKNIFQVTAIFTSERIKISIAQVSTLFEKNCIKVMSDGNYVTNSVPGYRFFSPCIKF